MVKFLAIALSAVAALFATGTDAAAQCAPLSFVDKSADVTLLNTLIDLGGSTGLLKGQLAALEPISVQNKRLDAVPFSVLGVDFTLTPVIQSLTVNGISNVVPGKLNVTGPTNLAIGARFDGELSLAATLSFEIKQLNHKWWQVCWTNILKPKNCPPAIVDLDATVGLHKLNMGTNVMLSMVQCPPNAQAGTCKDLTVNDIITSALGGDVNGLLVRILRRIKEVAIADLELGFDQVTQLHFHFHKSGPLVTELGKKLLAFSTKEVNKKGDLYNALISVSNKLGKTLINQVIKDKLSASFGNTCYDA